MGIHQRLFELREVGISTCVVLNDNIEEQDYINIADYIVE